MPTRSRVQEDAFRLSSFNPPRVDTLTPGQVPTAGDTVVVSGANFEDGALAELVLCQDEAGAEQAGDDDLADVVHFVSPL